MNMHNTPVIARRSPGPQGEKIITLAALAVGGQGGGVLTNWIVDVAEANGWHAQSTSVAGVAQRTGATIYYVEMCPDTGRVPVFALSPSEGDVDVMLAAELMEAGRALVRGFVTPGRTTLIASTHRIAAVSEKVVPGDGRADSDLVKAALGVAADHLVAFDMETVAQKAGSVISASMFGALAGSGALPFPRESYEKVIERSGKAAAASLRAFGAAYEIARGTAEAPKTDAVPEKVRTMQVPEALRPEWDRLLARVTALPAPVATLAALGLAKVVDFQDLAYGADYLDRLDRAVALDAAPWTFSEAAAKYLANAMCYDDIIRVADIKTRSSRHARVRGEVGVKEDQVLRLTEYFHPRFEEFVTTLPAGLGRWLSRQHWAERLYARRFDKGRRVRTDSMSGFTLLWLIGALRPIRRRLLRHEGEMAHVGDWYALALEIAPEDRALATEVLATRRLVKGYSDTHARGLSKFDRVIGAVPVLRGRADAADWLRRLRTAALADEKGDQLDGALKTVHSFAG